LIFRMKTVDPSPCMHLQSGVTKNVMRLLVSPKRCR